MHDNPVGPHPRGSCQLTVEARSSSPRSFPGSYSTARASRSSPIAQTGNALKDHTEHVIWLGPSETLKLSALN